MRTLIVAAALALGTLGFIATPAADAHPRWGHRHGYYSGRYYGGYRGWGVYPAPVWTYSARPIWRGSYWISPYGYGYNSYPGYYSYSYYADPYVYPW